MKIRDFFDRLFHNITYKLAALMLALITWYVVQGEEILEVNAKMDVKIDVPSGLAIRDSNLSSRDITLRGPRALVGALQGKALKAIVRVPPGKTGSYRFRLDKEFLPQWDNRIRLTIHDPYVSVAVEDLVVKKVPVKPTLIGDLADDYEVESINTTPSMIEISGPKSELSRISELTTDPIDISKLSDSKTYISDIFRANFVNVAIQIASVSVSVNIGAKKSSKSFALVPIELSDTEKVGTLRPNAVNVILSAPENVLEGISQKQVRAIVSAKGFAPGRYDVEVSVQTPDGVVVKEITPKRVSLEIYNQKKLK